MPAKSIWKWTPDGRQVLRRSAVRKYVAFLINRCQFSPNTIRLLLKGQALTEEIEQAIQELKGNRHATNP